MSYWKTAGLTYLQYITQATSALRNVVKPNLQAKYWPKEEISYRKQTWDRATGKPSSDKSKYRWKLNVYIIIR